MKLGCHVSISGSIDKSFERAKAKNCNTFQIFTKNPRRWAFRELRDKEIQNFKQKINDRHLYPVYAHISYLPNLASQNEEIYQKSMKSFLGELERCMLLNIPYFIIHGGSHKGGSFREGLSTYTQSILQGLDFTENRVKILIENSSGSSNSLTGDMESISMILNEIDDTNSVGVCFDTCHAFTAGYDLSSEKGINKTYEIIEENFSKDWIDVIHANDSKGELGSHKDYHEHIGLGKIGANGFKKLVNHKFFGDLPWILETPITENRGDEENIKYVLSLKEKN